MNLAGARQKKFEKLAKKEEATGMQSPHL